MAPNGGRSGWSVLGARVAAVNVGGRGAVELRGEAVPSGIDKRPVDGTCQVDGAGLVGDFRGDPQRRSHPDYAVSAYPSVHYAHWAGLLDRAPWPAGTFGENLTIDGVNERSIHVGDVLRAGDVLLQVTQPRTPCRKLDVRIGEPFSKRFLRSGRVGWYMRVLRPGAISAGDAVSLVERAASAPTIDACVRMTFFEYWDADALEALGAVEGLSEMWRDTVGDRLERARDAAGWAGLRPLRVFDLAAGRHELRCAAGRHLPAVHGGERMTLVWRPREQDRALRGIFRIAGATTEAGGYPVEALPEHGDAVLSLRQRASGETSVVLAEAPRPTPG